MESLSEQWRNNHGGTENTEIGEEVNIFFKEKTSTKRQDSS
jgi:hypothetical protein